MGPQRINWSYESIAAESRCCLCTEARHGVAFRPPSVSHWGGVCKRMIGIVITILPAVLSKTRLADEILHTVFFFLSRGIINARPLTKLSDGSNDLSPLTPNLLLLLRGENNVPPGVFSQSDTLRKRWRHVQHLADQLWCKWRRTYLPELQRRVKWTRTSQNLRVGDVVIILDEMTLRNLWPLARVTQVIHGCDGLMRTVKVKTKRTELVRPITKVVLLESADVSLYEIYCIFCCVNLIAYT